MTEAISGVEMSGIDIKVIRGACLSTNLHMYILGEEVSPKHSSEFSIFIKTGTHIDEPF